MKVRTPTSIDQSSIDKSLHCFKACTKEARSFSRLSSTPITRTSLQKSNVHKQLVNDFLPTVFVFSQWSDISFVHCQIYHPNVDLEGNVCLNILREDWKPVLNLNSVMVGLQYLFLEPNADDPLNKGIRFPSLTLRELTSFSRGCRRSAQEPRPVHSQCCSLYARRVCEGCTVRQSIHQITAL